MKKLKPKSIFLKPIGYVRSRANEGEIKKNRNEIVSEIIIEKKLAEALDGIEEFSHLFVIYFMHDIKTERLSLKRHPRHRKELARVGIFALREPMRPNPIGLTVVELLGRKENILKVRGLDALDGSPVLDIKTYDYIDRKEKIKVARWWFAAHPSHVSEK